MLKIKVTSNIYLPGLNGKRDIELEWPRVKRKTAHLKQRMALDLQSQNIASLMDVQRERKHNMECVFVDFQYQDLLQKMKRHPVAPNVKRMI
jgi:hypothetical protein